MAPAQGLIFLLLLKQLCEMSGCKTRWPWERQRGRGGGEEEGGAKAGGSRERARDWQLRRAGWKVRRHRGMRGHKGPKALRDRAEEWVIKNIWWHFMEAEKEASAEAEIRWHLHI